MLIEVGTNELLLDHSTRLAARARAAVVDIILDATADVPHVFQWLADVLDVADEALDQAASSSSAGVPGPGAEHARQRSRTASGLTPESP